MFVHGSLGGMFTQTDKGFVHFCVSVRYNIILLKVRSHIRKANIYHQRMRVGNVFGYVCLSVCVSVFLSVQAITFELLDIETSFLVCRYILTISRSSLSIKVISRSLGQSQDHIRKNDSFTYFNFLILCMWLRRSLIRSKSHIKVKVTSRSK